MRENVEVVLFENKYSSKLHPMLLSNIPRVAVSSSPLITFLKPLEQLNTLFSISFPCKHICSMKKVTCYIMRSWSLLSVSHLIMSFFRGWEVGALVHSMKCCRPILSSNIGTSSVLLHFTPKTIELLDSLFHVLFDILGSWNKQFRLSNIVFLIHRAVKLPFVSINAMYTLLITFSLRELLLAVRNFWC